MFDTHHKPVQKKIVGLLVGIIVFTSLFGSAAKHAEAQSFAQGAANCTMAALVSLVAESIASSFASIRVPIDDMPAWIKDTILDCLVWQLKQEIIEDITERTVGYVQSGMNGNPSFVTNLGSYLRDIADKAAGAYIDQTIPLLCSPFQGEIKIALTNYYRRYAGLDYLDRVSCSLTEVIDNVDDFVNGDFSAGGWDAWFSYVGNPYNNPLGSYIEGREELAARIRSATGEAEVKVNLGSGFLSKEVQQCYATVNGQLVPIDTEQIGSYPGAESYECDEPQIVTPGDTIKTSLEQAFGVSLDQLATADELNEIIALWLTSIFVDVLDSDEGLSGYQREDFDFGSTTDDGNPVDSTKPPVQSSCGTGAWLESTATQEGAPLVYEQNGLLLDSSQDHNAVFYIPNVVSNQIYKRATMRFEFEIGNWAGAGDSGEVYQLGFLQRSDDLNHWQENNIGLLNINRAGNKFIAGNNLNITIGDCTKAKSKNYGFEQGVRYSVEYTYDTEGQVVSTVVRKAGGEVVYVEDTPTADAIQTNHPYGDGQAGFLVYIGGPNQPDGYEIVLPPNWKFYNLSVSIE